LIPDTGEFEDVKLSVLAIGLGLSSGPVAAAGPFVRAFHSASDQPRATRSFDIRLVQEPPAPMTRIRQAGMIAQTGVAPNMDLGLGLFSAKRIRLSPFEPRLEGRTKVSRKLGLSFNWRF
jgi:hypothetical protein